MAQPPPSARAEKRLLLQPTANASNKRRAPYVPRACDACRKRKGRCDGLKPCEYCSGRSIDCNYTYNAESRQNDEALAAGDRSSPTYDQSSLESLSALVRSMQEQLATLSAQVQASVTSQPTNTSQAGKDSDMHGRQGSNAIELMVPPSDPLESQTANTTKRAVKRFVGPTSVDYSFNVAELTSMHGKHGHQRSSQSQLPSMDDDQSDEEDNNLSEQIRSPSSAFSNSTQALPANLLHFKTLIKKEEAVRLIYVYKEIVDPLHPIYSIDRLFEEIEQVYDWPHVQTRPIAAPYPFPDELSLLIINVVLCIALCAETTAQSPHCKTILCACENMINAKIMSASQGVKQVTLTLLVGIYHYFMGRISLAWRMCGIAGRQAMELGLHNRDASHEYPDGEQSHAEIVALSCSLVVLDRQWSSSAGLPPNFQFSDFELALKSTVDTPYLRAMLAFVLVSHKFNEPISRAARGEMFEDDDAFDVLNFQVDQWRKKSIPDHNFVHPEHWQSMMASKRPPTWAIMLYLRSNAIKAILLRPFFLDQTDSDARKRKIRPTLDVITDSISAITILDDTTDIYRKQHSIFQHFLAVSCATLSLLVAYVKRHRDSLTVELPSDFAESIKDNYWKAVRLSAAYSPLFASSRRLWRRLITMRDPLITLGILSEENSSLGSLPGGAQGYSVGGASGAKAVNSSGEAQMNQNYLPEMTRDDLSAFDMFCTNDDGGANFEVDFFAAADSAGMGEFQLSRYP